MHKFRCTTWFTRPVTDWRCCFCRRAGQRWKWDLGTTTNPATARRPIQSGLMTHPLTGLSCEGSDLLATDSYLAASDSFRSVAKGHITPIIDPDGAIRKVPAAICIDGHAFSSACNSTSIATSTSRSDWEASIRKESGLLSSSMTMNLGAFSSFTIPLDSGGNLRVSFHKSPDAHFDLSRLST